MDNQVNNGLENVLYGNEANNPQIIFNNAHRYLLSLNWVQLANTYKSSGFVQTAVDLPVADAFRDGGFELDSNTLSTEEISELIDYMSDKGDIETLKDCLRWGRLFGGGVIVINTEQDTTTPFNPATLKDKEAEFIAFDRWQCYPQATSLFLAKSFLLQDTLMGDKGNSVIFDKSRVKVFTGKTQPYYIRSQLQGWGASILEQVVPALNQYLKANSVILELLDEAKIDIIKIFGLADTLVSAEGESTIKRRIDIVANNKNYKSMIAMDSQDDYEQKQVSFGGLDQMLEKIFLLICSSLRIPYSKVFGKGANGFSSGEDDLENYNAMISSEIRVPATQILKWMIDIRCYQLFGRKVDDMVIKWKPLRVLSEKEQQDIDTAKVNTYIQLLQSGVMTPKQVAEKLNTEQIVLFNEEEINKLKDDFEPDDTEMMMQQGKEEKAENGFLQKYIKKYIK